MLKTCPNLTSAGQLQERFWYNKQLNRQQSVTGWVDTYYIALCVKLTILQIGISVTDAKYQICPQVLETQ